MIPLILNNTDTVDPVTTTTTSVATYQGATTSHITTAITTSALAFPTWSRTEPSYRRNLLNKTASLLRSRANEFCAALREETHTSQIWAEANVSAGIELLEETAGLISEVVKGSVPVVKDGGVALVTKGGIGVVLGIAPWNAAVILGLRAIVAPLAAGNTVIFKGSELSPKSHYLVANLFRDAGFPPGVLNFVLHRPEDAPALYEQTISNPHVRKCNFTGSTAVGRIIASKAAFALKPVLLELGGKNFALVLDDADVKQAAEEITLGAFLNNGQICMSTDLVYVSDDIAPRLISALLQHLQNEPTCRIINPASKARLDSLLADAKSKGAIIHQPPPPSSSVSDGQDGQDETIPPTIIENLTPEMAFYSTESFGPILGIVRTPTESCALGLIASSSTGHSYGLSASIFTKAHFRALKIADSWRVAAVHVNSMTVHDEATLPHGGMGESGFGRFGGRWGVEEFLVERVVVLNS